MKTIVYTRFAEKQLLALPLKAQEAVEGALEAYALTGRGDVIRLTGRPALRMRIGVYRAIFNEDGTTVLAIYIGRRNEATYRGD